MRGRVWVVAIVIVLVGSVVPTAVANSGLAASTVAAATAPASADPISPDIVGGEDAPAGWYMPHVVRLTLSSYPVGSEREGGF